MDTIDKVMLTYSSIKLIDVTLCIAYVVICIGTSRIEIFHPRSQVPGVY